MSSPGESKCPVVFVVDDDVSVRESLELLIRSAGWQPETFVSAEDFLARLPVEGPCCLVLDLSLPNLNGLDLQKRIAGTGMPKPTSPGTDSDSAPMMNGRNARKRK